MEKKFLISAESNFYSVMEVVPESMVEKFLVSVRENFKKISGRVNFTTLMKMTLTQREAMYRRIENAGTLKVNIEEVKNA